LAIVITGARLLRRPESAATSLLWYAVASFAVASAWFVWTLLVERSTYVLSLPA
jgi:hypothetical protein